MAYATTITDVLNQWAEIGVFAYVLPFLMIFAVIYGILSKTQILGGRKGVDATIALAAGLLSLQFDYVSNFFASIFPYTGIGLAVLLVALILAGMFIKEDENAFKWIYFGLGFIIFVAVLLTSLSDFRWWGGFGYGWGESWPAILVAVVVLGLIALVIWGGGQESGGKNKSG